MRRRGQRGFTIIELMMVVVVLAVLAAIAAPSFREMTITSQVRSAASDLYDSELFARSEAIKRNNQVSVVPSAGGWVGGWTVQDNGGNVLQRRDPLTGGTIAVGAAGNLAFRLDGRVSSALRSFTVYSTTSTNIKARCVSLDASGRPTVRMDNDANFANGCV